MGKKQPPNTTGHLLFVPDDLHQKLKILAKYGEVDDLIIRCIRDGFEPHWRKFISQERLRDQTVEHQAERKGIGKR